MCGQNLPLQKAILGKQIKAKLFLAFSILNECNWQINWTSQSEIRIITIDNNKNKAKNSSHRGQKEKENSDNSERKKIVSHS